VSGRILDTSKRGLIFAVFVVDFKEKAGDFVGVFT
jgi:hypothetical protein